MAADSLFGAKSGVLLGDCRWKGLVRRRWRAVCRHDLVLDSVQKLVVKTAQTLSPGMKEDRGKRMLSWEKGGNEVVLKMRAENEEAASST